MAITHLGPLDLVWILSSVHTHHNNSGLWALGIDASRLLCSFPWQPQHKIGIAHRNAVEFHLLNFASCMKRSFQCMHRRRPSDLDAAISSRQGIKTLHMTSALCRSSCVCANCDLPQLWLIAEYCNLAAVFAIAQPRAVIWARECIRL